MSLKEWLHGKDLLERIESVDSRSIIIHQRHDQHRGLPRPLFRLAEMLNHPFGWGLESRDKFGQTPLHRAVRDHDPERTQKLADKGAELAALNNAYQTPLDLAKSLRDQDCAQVLETWRPSLREAAGDGIASAALTLQNQPE